MSIVSIPIASSYVIPSIALSYSVLRFLIVFLHPYSETSWEDQNTRESLVERTVRATAHARKTLMAGFTAVRYVTPPI